MSQNRFSLSRHTYLSSTYYHGVSTRTAGQRRRALYKSRQTDSSRQHRLHQGVSRDEFRQYLKTHVEDQLIVGNNTSYIDIAHLLGDMLQKDAMIIMAAASIADPSTYKCLSQPEGMPLPIEGKEFSRALVNAFLESNLATMFPGLIRLK